MSSATAVLQTAQNDTSVKTGIDSKAREQIAKSLSKVLTQTYSLMLKTHIYHWNVVGPMFHTIHEMSEEQYTDLFKASDVIAERIRALGHRAPVDSASLPIDAGVESGMTAHQMVEDLVQSHEAAVREMRDTAELCEEHHDFVSHDLLVERLTYHEKILWMWRSLLAD